MSEAANMEGRLSIGRGLSIGEDELKESFVRASGPGGQNVNKVSTAISLRFDLTASALPEPVKRRAASAAGQRLTKAGEIVMRADTHRTLAANREAARARLLALLTEAAIPPRFRVKTKPSRSARAKRVDRKVVRGRKKALRQRPPGDE
jgi:ribosome-associated protein|tara:strand:- start:12080 stop:12526 length:447 start_codon:yes stop_codon:yes gene_type:complete